MKWDSTPKYYVYVLHNPTTQRPFYVGKGQGKRMFQHEKNIKRGKLSNNGNWPLYKEMKQILKEGFKPIYQKVESNVPELEALVKEQFWIKYFDIENLCNIKRDGFQAHIQQKPEATKELMRRINGTPEARERSRQAGIRGNVKRFGGFVNWFIICGKKEERKELIELKKIAQEIRKELKEYYRQEQHKERLIYQQAAFNRLTNGQWKRNCPQCNGIIIHKRRDDCRRSLKRKAICLKCMGINRTNEYWQSDKGKEHLKRLRNNKGMVTLITAEQRAKNIQKAIEGIERKLAVSYDEHLTKTLAGMKHRL